MTRPARGRPTRIDVGTSDWIIDDEPTHLREWGTPRIYQLPPTGEELTIGAAETCSLHLVDPSCRVSRQHARLSRERSGWVIRDQDSTNGTWLDGARQTQIPLVPGAEIGIGPFTLVAESPALLALRGFLARLLGWGPDQIMVLDRAMRALRSAIARRAALHVCGPGDLVPIARALHLRTLGEARPFVVCDPRRRGSAANVRSAESIPDGRIAIAAAAGGTMCVRLRRPPPEFSEIALGLRDPASRAQIVVCTDAARDVGTLLADPIVIPPLAHRRAELDRIVGEYARDALTSLGAASGFTHADHAWVIEHASGSLPEIEKSTLRLVAIREAGSVAQAAARLGMSHVALAQWIGHRRLP